jgi:hypothetical protein
LDIHKESIALAIADADRAAPRFIGTINPVPAELCKAMRRVCTKESTLIVYEAGPCGYGWVRYLRKQGWACDVIAPSRITRKPSEKRIKTDRRDALLLARESRSGNLTSIVVPDERDEATRDCRFPHSLSNPSGIDVQLPCRIAIHASSWTSIHRDRRYSCRFQYCLSFISTRMSRIGVRRSK